MTMRSLAFALLAVLAALLPGCISYKYPLQDVTPVLAARGSGPVAVATLDRRPEVTSEDEDPEYAGIMRDAYGIPRDVSTGTGEPFADEWTGAAARALRAAGFEPRTTNLPLNTPDADASAALAKLSTGKSVLFTIRKWQPDTYVETTLHYDVSAAVLDRSGRSVATKSISGDAELGAGGWGVIMQAFAKQIAQLLDAPEVAGALR